MRRVVMAVLCLLPCSCNYLDTDVQRGYEQNHGWTEAASYTTADVRIITEQKRPGSNYTVICAEPSPDVAEALSTAAKLTLQGGNGAANGNAGISGSSAEAFAELAGRSTALLGLRDGLFHACEAYADGIIGQDTYALILSRYGQLMTTLFLGQDITGAAAPAGGGKNVSPTLQPSANSPTPGGTPGSTKTGTTSPRPAGNLELASDPPPPGQSAHRAPASMRVASRARMVRPLSLLAATSTPPSGEPATAPSPSPASPTIPPPSAGKDPQPGSSPGTSDVAAEALARMNEDYMNEGLLGPIIIACIDEFDPTRDMSSKDPSSASGASPDAGGNTWLRGICKEINLAVLLDLEKHGPPWHWNPVVPGTTHN